MVSPYLDLYFSIHYPTKLTHKFPAWRNSTYYGNFGFGDHTRIVGSVTKAMPSLKVAGHEVPYFGIYVITPLSGHYDQYRDVKECDFPALSEAIGSESAEWLAEATQRAKPLSHEDIQANTFVQRKKEKDDQQKKRKEEAKKGGKDIRR